MKPQVKASMAQLCLPHDRRHNEGHPIAFNVAYFEYRKKNFDTDIQRHWRDYFMDRDISKNAPRYIKNAAEVINYANLEEEEKEMIDLLERFEADRQAREDWVRDEATREATKKSIKSMMKFNIPLEKIADEYNMTVEQVNELLNDSSH
ncbi:MAG: hypothetical protein FWC47_08775 [Oscillospiraceae bacterium]|nr:hypothetical protein [Oscillospiraceae bacterium]